MVKILVIANLENGTLKTVSADGVDTKQYASVDRVLKEVGKLMNDGYDLVGSNASQMTLVKDPDRRVTIRKAGSLNDHFFG